MMITEGDTANIVYGLCKQLGLPVLQGGNAGSFSEGERVVVHAHRQERERQYLKNFLEVNIIVPDEAGEARTKALKEYERRVQDMFYEDIVGVYGGHGYVIELKSLGIEEEASLKSHFVNCKLLFSTLR